MYPTHCWDEKVNNILSITNTFIGKTLTYLLLYFIILCFLVLTHYTRALLENITVVSREVLSTLYNFCSSNVSFKVVCPCLKSLAKVSIMRGKHNGTMQHDQCIGILEYFKMNKIIHANNIFGVYAM